MSKLIRSIKYLFNRFALNKQYLIATEGNYQQQFKFKVEDCVGRSIYKTGHYEHEITKFLLNDIKINESDVVIDIGANIGWYSILISKKSGQKGQIYSFEPDNLNFDLLTFNIEKNKASNITAVKKAVSNDNSSKKLYRYKDSNLGRHSLLPINDGETVMVESTTLDMFAQENNINTKNIKLIKIDIEGYEYFAMLGANKILETTPMVVSEFAPTYIIKAGENPNDYISLMKKHNFIPHELINGKLESTPFAKLENLIEGVINIFWVKAIV